MSGWSQTIIVGNVGRDVEMRYTQAGIPVASFSVAVTRKFGSGDDRQEKTTWYKVTCWRQLAEIASQYVKKGMQVMVVGTVDVSAYINKEGAAAASLELTADTLQMLGGRGEAEPAGERGLPQANGGDIPF